VGHVINNLPNYEGLLASSQERREAENRTSEISKVWHKKEKTICDVLSAKLEEKGGENGIPCRGVVSPTLK
jgi:hypothetical protein